MVDNRSAGFYGIGGSFNFKSGDASGTAAKMSDEKMGQGGEYALIRKGEEEVDDQFNNQYVDRSAQINATLNSLAMANVAGILKNIKRSKKLEALLHEDDKTLSDENEFVEEISEDTDDSDSNNNNKNDNNEEDDYNNDDDLF